MIKLVYCIAKKPGLTDEEFFRTGKISTARSALEFLVSASWCRATA